MSGSLTAEQAKMALDSDKKIVLVDLRSPEEYRGGHIAGSINIPLDEIEDIAHIVPDCGTNIFLYCQCGKHSRCGRTVLMYLGYKQVWSICGIRDWPYGLV